MGVDRRSSGEVCGFGWLWTSVISALVRLHHLHVGKPELNERSTHHPVRQFQSTLGKVRFQCFNVRFCKVRKPNHTHVSHVGGVSPFHKSVHSTEEGMEDNLFPCSLVKVVKCFVGNLRSFVGGFRVQRSDACFSALFPELRVVAAAVDSPDPTTPLCFPSVFFCFFHCFLHSLFSFSL